MIKETTDKETETKYIYNFQTDGTHKRSVSTLQVIYTKYK